MFLKERHDKIIELINSEGRVTVTDLAELFSVTDDCIRKDLKQLDAQGKLQRVYGGAVSVASASWMRVERDELKNSASATEWLMRGHMRSPSSISSRQASLNVIFKPLAVM